MEKVIKFYREHFGLHGDPNPEGTTINKSVFRFAQEYADHVVETETVTGIKLEPEEPIALKANDPKVVVNGKTIPVDFRIVPEDMYQFLMSPKRQRESIKEHICQDYKPCVGKKDAGDKILCTTPNRSCIWRKGAV